jgi:hypothetical protein
MGFGDELKAWGGATSAAMRAIHHGSVFDAHKSITLGSTLTGAPGQPVQTGRLRNSWQIEILSPLEARILTSMIYAASIEHGQRRGKPITLRSQVGGFHSLKLTIQNWDRIVESNARRVARSKRFGGGRAA